MAQNGMVSIKVTRETIPVHVTDLFLIIYSGVTYVFVISDNDNTNSVKLTIFIEPQLCFRTTDLQNSKMGV